MIRNAVRLRTYLGAEEVPRSIGLLFVSVYVLALAAFGYCAYRHSHSMARTHAAVAGEQALQLLAETVGPVSAITEEESSRLQQRLLRFGATHRCVSLRIYDRELRVLASLSTNEVGSALARDAGASTAVQLTPSNLQSERLVQPAGPHKLLARCPVATETQGPELFVEGVFDLSPAPGVSSGTRDLHLHMMLIALASSGALLFAYRRLRRHFRSISKITDNLVNGAGRLEQGKSGVFDTSDFRIDGARDLVAASWNRLVDFTASLDEEVARSAASTELLAALNRSQTGELAEAMTSAPIGIVLVTEQGDVQYANAMAGRLIGWNANENDHHCLAGEELSADGKSIAGFINSCMGSGGTSRIYDTQIAGGDPPGTDYYHVQVVPVRTQRQTRNYVTLIMDVSQQIRADRAREDFVSQVTHELRTPLTNIRAYAETLASGMFDDPQVITECYNVITKETRRLSRLIEDILSISQLEVGTMQLIIDDVDLRSLVTEAVRDVRGLAEAKNMELQLVLPPKLLPVKADRDKLAVVINNLLGNAIKYTAAGGHVVLACKTTETAVQISVRDNGIGIDPKDHGRIFEKFQRCDDEAVRNETGTGIGLTTAREIVRQHGGEITLVSKKGEGSTFTVTIPMKSQSPAPVAAMA